MVLSCTISGEDAEWDTEGKFQWRGQFEPKHQGRRIVGVWSWRNVLRQDYLEI